MFIIFNANSLKINARNMNIITIKKVHSIIINSFKVAIFIPIVLGGFSSKVFNAFHLSATGIGFNVSSAYML